MRLNMSCDGYQQTSKGHALACNCARDSRRWRKSFLAQVRYFSPDGVKKLLGERIQPKKTDSKHPGRR